MSNNIPQVDTSIIVGPVPSEIDEEEVKQEPTNNLVQPENIDKTIEKIFKNVDVSKYIKQKLQTAVEDACKKYLFELNNKKEKVINVKIKKPDFPKRIENINGKIKPHSKANIPLIKRAKMPKLNKNSKNRINLGFQIGGQYH